MMTTPTPAGDDPQRAPLPDDLEDALLVMGASMAGSIVQLPGVGGGSQLAVIELCPPTYSKMSPTISRANLPLAWVCCWLQTFMAVIPAGLIMAHRERISLRLISRESEIEATEAEQPERAPKMVAGQDSPQRGR